MLSSQLSLGCFALSIFAAASSAAPSCKSDNGGITLPKGFCALVVADGLGAARHIAVAPNGDVYDARQGDGEKGGVVALRDTNNDGKFEAQEHFGTGSLTGISYPKVCRYRLTHGECVPT